MKRTLIVIALAGLLAISGTACGGSSDAEGDDAGSGTTVEAAGPEVSTLSVGVLPIIDVAPLFIGIEQGFFEEEGLTIQPEIGVGGAAVVPAIVGGDLEVGFSGYTSLLAAQSEGLGLTVISDGVAAPEDADQDVTALVVAGDSAIESPADLEGARVGVNALRGVVELSTLVAAEEAGVDGSQINFVEVPIPELPAAVEAGEVDGAQMPDPFLTLTLNDGGRQILPAFSAVSPGLGYAGFFTTAEFASENPGTAAAFLAAMTKSLEYARDNPDAMRDALPTFTELSPELAGEVRLPAWPDGSVGSLEEALDVWADAMIEFDYLDGSSSDPSALLPSGE